ncbi:MAG: hypothetical protein PVI26_07700, partial [Chitinispirillia bacterium]
MNNCLYKLYTIFFSFVLTLAVFSEPPPRQLAFQDGDNIWFGTDRGLIRYQRENDLWSTVIADPVIDFEIDDIVLWLGTEQGLYYADLRYLDWKRYSKENGLPLNKITGVTADIDFIYAAGGNWLARMDKLVEQWETFGDFSHTKINDLYSDQDYLWVATDSGLYYYEKQFEKWKRFSYNDGLISDKVFRIFYFNDYLWILTDSGLSRYTVKMKTWNSYGLNSDIQGSAIKYIWVDADYIWLVAPENLVRFSSKNQVWENFSQNTQIENPEVNALSTSGIVSWFATSDGIYSYDEERRRWVIYTALEGLNDDGQEEIYCIGGSVVSKQANIFNVYQSSDDLWRSHELTSGQGEGSESEKTAFYNDERGIGFMTPGKQSISLLGRAYFKLKNRAEFIDPFWDNIHKYIFSKDLDSVEYAKYNDYLYWWPKAQLNLNVELNKGRTIRGSFDNTDLIDSLKYGLEYRGYGDDYIRRTVWQKILKTDYFHSTLIDPTYLEGSEIRAEFGRRVGEKKRRRVNTGVWAGWRKTDYICKLIPFQEDNFYLLKINNIIVESVELRIDGKVIDPREYSIERTQGSLIFKNDALINPDSRIEISCEYLQNDTIPGEYTNDLIAFENVVTFNDNISIGVNGVYHGFEEYDQKGVDFTKNRLYSGNLNGKIELKSSDEKMTFKAIPEISTSYNDSILLIKQGTAIKLNTSAVLYNFRLRGLTEYYTSYYETIADIFSIYGRKNYYGEFEAVYDITPFMPLSAGFNITDANRGNEISTFFEYLLAPADKPSLKLCGLFQKRKN